MTILLTIIGLIAGVAIVTKTGAFFILQIYTSEEGSNAHMREWLLENPGLELDAYPHQ